MSRAASHLISIQQLSTDFLLSFFSQIKKNKTQDSSPIQILKDQSVCLMFLEPSTRTRVSFEIAAGKLGAQTILIQKDGTSLQKGESVLDTFQTIHAMGCRIFVYRSSDSSIQEVAKHFGEQIILINAGDGMNEHPTQALLDGFTIWERYPDFKNLKIAIVGDIARSRVAHSNITMLNMFGIKPYVAGPSELLKNLSDQQVHLCKNIDEAISDADVVMMLRIQNERKDVSFSLDDREYINTYGLTTKRLALAKKNAMVMHPGPFNRGVEIESAVADGLQSSILQQVNNGIWTRLTLFQVLSSELK